MIKYHRNYLAGILEREKEMDAKKTGLAAGKLLLIDLARLGVAGEPRINGFWSREALPFCIAKLRANQMFSGRNPKEDEKLCHGFRDGSALQDRCGLFPQQTQVGPTRAGQEGRGGSSAIPAGCAERITPLGIFDLKGH